MTTALGSLLIEQVAAGEHDAVDRLITAAYDHDYGPREKHGDEPDPIRFARVRSKSFDVWVARDAGTGALVGTVTTPAAGGESLMEDSRDDEFDFRLLAVSPDARRRGIGAALTLHVIDVARARGFRGVFMKSGPDMLGAHRLYERLGFHRDPARDGLIRAGRRVFDLFAFAYDISDLPDSPDLPPLENPV